jgi:hypothetical protein
MDFALTTPWANPIPLNSLGQALVYLQPSLTYKFNLTDSQGNQIPGYPIDNVSGSGYGSNLIPTASNTFNIGSSTVTWANGYFGTNLYVAGTPVVTYPQSANETTAFVTTGGSVVNFSRPYFDVDRYGANVAPGTTDMTIAWNSACAAALIAGGEVTYGYTSQYLLTAPINCTAAGGGNQPGVTIRGLSAQDASYSILAAHNAVAIFDCTGNDNITFTNVSMRTQTGFAPSVGILTARNSAGGGTVIRMTNVRIIGNFLTSCYYNYGSEDDVLIACYFYNGATSASTSCAIYTATNSSSLQSSVAGLIATGARSTTDHTMIGCQLYNAAGTATSYCVYLDEVTFYRSYACWMACFGATGGQAYIGINQANAPSNNCVIDGLMGEQNGTNVPAYGILFFGTASSNVGWSITNCLLPNTNLAISVNGTLNSCYISNITEQPATSHGLAAVAVTTSTINAEALILAITTSTNNTLIGYTERWTIGTRVNDNWVDMGTSNKTWTPVVSGLTHSGTLAVTSAKMLLFGNACTVELTMAAVTSLTPTAGQTITGLPFAAVAPAVVDVVDGTTPIALGQGVVTGTTLVMPAFSAGTHTVTVSATYFIA